MFCKYCGKMLPEGADICPNCGRGAAVGFVIYFLLVLVCIILVICGLFAFSEAMREGTRMALSALSFMGV